MASDILVTKIDTNYWIAQVTYTGNSEAQARAAAHRLAADLEDQMDGEWTKAGIADIVVQSAKVLVTVYREDAVKFIVETLQGLSWKLEYMPRKRQK